MMTEERPSSPRRAARAGIQADTPTYRRESNAETREWGRLLGNDVPDYERRPSPVASHVHEPDAHVTPYTTPTSAFAVVSLIFGLGVFFTLGFTGLPAVILGHVAHGETVTGERAGHGMTVAGLFFGYLAIAAWVFVLVFFTWVARDTQIPHIQIPNINNQN